VGDNPKEPQTVNVSSALGYDDFSLERVPKAQVKSTWDIALVRMGLTVSASDLVFGYTLGLYFPFWRALLISLAFSAIIGIISVLMGIIGVRERTSFALSSRLAFGRDGSRLPSLLIALGVIGFYGYILGITVDVFPDVGFLGYIIYSVVLGALFIVISSLGFGKGLRVVARIGVPLMIVLVVVAVVTTIIHVGGFGTIVAAVPSNAGGMSLAAIIGLGVAKWMAGAVVTPDLLRFGRSNWTAVTTTVAEFIVGNVGFNLLGLILGLGLGKADLGSAFGIIGLSWLATVAFLVQGITVEMNELYIAGLAISNTVGIRRYVTNIVIGIIGIGIAVWGLQQGIIDSFLTFIGYFGYAIPVIPGIIIADYFVVRRMRYNTKLDETGSVNWRAVAALLVTIAINVGLNKVTGDSFWHTLPLFGFVVYLLLSIGQVHRHWKADRSDAPEARRQIV
jgi:cytosine permease